MPQVSRSTVVDVTPQQLLEVVGDFEKYPQFLPEVKGAKINKREGSVLEVTYEIDVIKRISYTLRHVIDAPNLKATWTLVKGDLMKKNEGSWVLKPEGEGKVHATYTLDLVFGGLIPVPSSITDALAKNNLPVLLENFKKRAESIYRRNA